MLRRNEESCSRIRALDLRQAEQSNEVRATEYVFYRLEFQEVKIQSKQEKGLLILALTYRKKKVTEFTLFR